VTTDSIAHDNPQVPGRDRTVTGQPQRGTQLAQRRKSEVITTEPPESRHTLAQDVREN